MNKRTTRGVFNRDQALRLRDQGFTYKAIGAKLGVSTERARELWAQACGLKITGHRTPGFDSRREAALSAIRSAADRLSYEEDCGRIRNVKVT